MAEVAPLLIGRGLSVSYGGVHALRGFDIEVNRGEIVGVIGPNGAGKTSFIDGVCGFAQMTGSLSLDGVDLLGLRAHKRIRAGLSRTWQSVALFDSLTVAENLAVATGRRASRRRDQQADQPDAVHNSLDRLGISHLKQLLPSQLSHGQRVLVGVARAISVAPKLVLMDEPAAGLDDAEGVELGKFIKILAQTGIGVLLVDHDMNLVFDVCDRIYVLDFGKLIAIGTPVEVANHPAVVAAYLGTRDAAGSQPGEGATA
jgi:ABC-type branched-subunit amino acid transport system ATPase component